jgi:predicted naringenin-chalcone synthase
MCRMEGTECGETVALATRSSRRHHRPPLVLDRLLSRVGVESRHLALPIEAYDGLTSWGKANDAWIEVSEELAELALCKALTRAGLSVTTQDVVE